MTDAQLDKWGVRALYIAVIFFLIISLGHPIWWFSLVCLIIGHASANGEERREAERQRRNAEIAAEMQGRQADFDRRFPR